MSKNHTKSQKVPVAQPVPALACQLGGERIVLPHQTHAGLFVDEPYWPTGSLVLNLVCIEHGHLSVCTKHNLLVERVPLEGRNGPDTAFWRTEFVCGQNNCASRIVVHARTSAGDSTQTVAEAIFSARPGPTCVEGHTLSSLFAKLESIEAVRL